MPEPVPIRSEEPPVQKVIATGLTLIVGLSDNQQLTFQSGYEGDEDDRSIRDRLDRMSKLAAWMKARAELPQLKKQLAKLEKDRRTFVELQAQAEHEHPVQIAKRRFEIEEMIRLKPGEREANLAEMNAKILEVQGMKAAEFNRGLETYRKSGRQGSYIPRGADKTNLDRMDDGIKRLEEAREKDIEAWSAAYDKQIEAAEADIHRVEEDRKQAVEGHARTVARHDEEIAALNEQLAECQELIDGG